MQQAGVVFYGLGRQRSAGWEELQNSFLTESAGKLLSIPVSPS